MLIDGLNVLRKPFIDILVKNAKTVTQLEGIVVFGSSVREDCTEESDVDILFTASAVDFDDTFYSLAILELLQSCYSVQYVDVMELVDIADLKSAGPCDRAGSIPAPSKLKYKLKIKK